MAQTHNARILVSAGLQQMAVRNVVFNPFFSDEGGYIVSQSGTPSFDCNIIFSQQLGHPEKKAGILSLLYGIDLNRKAFRLNAMISDGGPRHYPAEIIEYRNYVGFLLGADLKILSYNKMSLSIAQLLNPEMSVGERGGTGVLGLSSRSVFLIERAIKNKNAVNLSAYFQYGLTNYRWYPASVSKYRPIGIGVTLGYAFN